jgi:hypothetical protein
MGGFDISTDTSHSYIYDFSSESSGDSIPIIISDVQVLILVLILAKLTIESIPIIRKLVMGGSEAGTDTESRWNISNMAASPWGAQGAIRKCYFV